VEERRKTAEREAEQQARRQPHETSAAKATLLLHIWIYGRKGRKQGKGL